MLNRILFVALIIFGVSACQSTGVIPMGHGTYMIGKKDGSPGLGVSLSNKAEVYKEANTFCHEKGLKVETIKVTVSPAKLAKLGSTELEFKCVTTEQ
ncbi:hypothetical protein [Shewanella sp. T24-MNA-CIBAN-0130]|uniref:hypothetical protein n=1 Tax=Shewanella sp. T24-MNA-CIBAN-0130 TaxID=3140470 RepID=UPI00331CCE3E